LGVDASALTIDTPSKRSKIDGISHNEANGGANDETIDESMMEVQSTKRKA
jgi:hypothetical protein